MMKIITAIVVLQLVQENCLQLEDPLDQLLSGLEIPNGENITVHHLLLHISGLPNERIEVYQSSFLSWKITSGSLRAMVLTPS